MKRFAKQAEKDLCQKDGILYKQWKKWGDLDNKDVIKTFGAILATTFGISGNLLPPLIVATTVIIVHIGVETICEEYNEK